MSNSSTQVINIPNNPAGVFQHFENLKYQWEDALKAGDWQTAQATEESYNDSLRQNGDYISQFSSLARQVERTNPEQAERLRGVTPSGIRAYFQERGLDTDVLKNPKMGAYWQLSKNLSRDLAEDMATAYRDPSNQYAVDKRNRVMAVGDELARAGKSTDMLDAAYKTYEADFGTMPMDVGQRLFGASLRLGLPTSDPVKLLQQRFQGMFEGQKLADGTYVDAAGTASKLVENLVDNLGTSVKNDPYGKMRKVDTLLNMSNKLSASGVKIDSTNVGTYMARMSELADTFSPDDQLVQMASTMGVQRDKVGAAKDALLDLHVAYSFGDVIPAKTVEAINGRARSQLSAVFPGAEDFLASYSDPSGLVTGMTKNKSTKAILSRALAEAGHADKVPELTGAIEKRDKTYDIMAADMHKIMPDLSSADDATRRAAAKQLYDGVDTVAKAFKEGDVAAAKNVLSQVTKSMGEFGEGTAQYNILAGVQKNLNDLINRKSAAGTSAFGSFEEAMQTLLEPTPDANATVLNANLATAVTALVQQLQRSSKNDTLNLGDKHINVNAIPSAVFKPVGQVTDFVNTAVLPFTGAISSLPGYENRVMELLKGGTVSSSKGLVSGPIRGELPVSDMDASSSPIASELNTVKWLLQNKVIVRSPSGEFTLDDKALANASRRDLDNKGKTYKLDIPGQGSFDLADVKGQARLIALVMPGVKSIEKASPVIETIATNYSDYANADASVNNILTTSGVTKETLLQKPYVNSAMNGAAALYGMQALLPGGAGMFGSMQKLKPEVAAQLAVQWAKMQQAGDQFQQSEARMLQTSNTKAANAQSKEAEAHNAAVMAEARRLYNQSAKDNGGVAAKSLAEFHKEVSDMWNGKR